MRVFSCKNCLSNVYFENIVCVNCGMALGFDPVSLDMKALQPRADGELLAPGEPPLGYCANYARGVCNWLVAQTPKNGLCLSCRLNRTIPDLSVSGNVHAWFEIEKAKRHLLYSLLMLQLPVTPSRNGMGQTPQLAFEIIAGANTGHKNGVITINLAEADPAMREETRVALNQEQRTLLGHFRHESGHYFWMLFSGDAGWLDSFRRMFGDERPDYDAAIAAYHQNGPPPDWQQNHISAYAAAHPWEDWAETWANYLHMADSMEMANSFRLKLTMPSERQKWFPSTVDPYNATSANQLIEHWLPVALALNAMNRCMGLTDFYPFVISPRAVEKLNFVRQTVTAMRPHPK